MPDTFRFKQEPQWIMGDTSVVLCIEDFECLLRLAERWLNSDGLMRTEDQGYSNTKLMAVEKSEPVLPDMKEEFVPDTGHRPIDHRKTFPLDQKKDDTDEESVLEQVSSMSETLKSIAGQKLGKSPLDFLSKELSKFTSARAIFSTNYHLPETSVASEFHKACDNVPNVLVIIKSGQYIAGGYTEVPFESRNRKWRIPDFLFKPDPKLTTFLFSVNKQKIYPLKDKNRALNCRFDRGPSFGFNGLSIAGDYLECMSCIDNIHKTDSSFYSPTNAKGELFGVSQFSADEYEVYKLE